MTSVAKQIGNAVPPLLAQAHRRRARRAPGRRRVRDAARAARRRGLDQQVKRQVGDVAEAAAVDHAHECHASASHAPPYFVAASSAVSINSVQRAVVHAVDVACARATASQGFRVALHRHGRDVRAGGPYGCGRCSGPRAGVLRPVAPHRPLARDRGVKDRLRLGTVGLPCEAARGQAVPQRASPAPPAFSSASENGSKSTKMSGST